VRAVLNPLSHRIPVGARRAGEDLMQLARIHGVALALALGLAAPAAAKQTFVYLHDAETDVVYAFSLGRHGELAAVPGSPFDGPAGGGACGGQCQTLTYDKKGKALFASSPGGVTAWSVAKDGSLTLVPGSPFEPAGGAGTLSGTALVRRGKAGFLYVADNSGAQLLGFAIQPGGALVELAGFPLTGFVGPTGAAAVKDKLFVADESGGTIASFRVEKDGSLSDAPGSPVTPAVLGYTFNATPDRKAKFLYVADNGPRVHVFRVDKKTAAIAEVPGSPFGPNDPVAGNGASVTKRVVYLCAEGGIYGLHIDRRTGAADPLGSVPAGITTDVHAVDAKGRRLLIGSATDDKVHSFLLDRRDGEPIPADAGTLPDASNLTGIAITN
jgi:hypothetical protein